MEVKDGEERETVEGMKGEEGGKERGGKGESERERGGRGGREGGGGGMHVERVWVLVCALLY